MQGHLHSWQGPHKRLAMVVLGTLGAAAFWIGGVLSQEAYPNKPVKIIVGMPAGSFTDLSARLIGDGLRHELNESFIVENRPGAATNIATQSVARSGKGWLHSTVVDQFECHECQSIQGPAFRRREGFHSGRDDRL